MDKLRRVVCGAALAFVASHVAQTAVAAEVSLKAVVAVPPRTSIAAPFDRFVEKFNADGKGIAKIQLLGPEALAGAELGNAVKSGVIDMAAVPPSYYKNLMIEGDTLVLSDMTFDEQRKSGAWAYLNKLHNEKMNVEFITAYGEGVPFHIYLSKPVDKPDFKGIKLRSLAIYQEFFQAIGATPISMAATEVYTGLERGVVDGYGWPLWGVEDLGWNKFTKYRVDPGFYTVLVNILFNADKWKSLTDEQRAYVRKTADWLDADYKVWSVQKTADEKKKQAVGGIQTITFGPEFRQKAHDLYWAALEKGSPTHVPALKKLLIKSN